MPANPRLAKQFEKDITQSANRAKTHAANRGIPEEHVPPPLTNPNLEDLPTIPVSAAGFAASASHSIFVVVTENGDRSKRTRALYASKDGALSAVKRARSKGREPEVFIAKLNYWGRLDTNG